MEEYCIKGGEGHWFVIRLKEISSQFPVKKWERVGKRWFKTKMQAYGYIENIKIGKVVV